MTEMEKESSTFVLRWNRANFDYGIFGFTLLRYEGPGGFRTGRETGLE